PTVMLTCWNILAAICVLSDFFDPIQANVLEVGTGFLWRLKKLFDNLYENIFAIFPRNELNVLNFFNLT
ncbi:hypothetical protein ACJX0J_015003, partial [Zea mays]